MESHARRLRQIRRLSYRCALIGAVALILLFADWIHLVATKSGGGILLPQTEIETNAVCLFDYTERAGTPHVEFGTNDSILQTGIQATDLEGNVAFSQTTYLLTERYLTPNWAKTQTSKYIWAELTPMGMRPTQPGKLPSQFIPLARQLANQQEPESASILNEAIDDTLSNTRYTPGIIRNLIAMTLVATVLLGCISFIYLFNKSRG